MVGGMDAARCHAGGGLHQKRAQDAGDLLRSVPPGDRRGGRHAVHHEARVGRRVEVRDEQIDSPLAVLQPFQQSCRETDALHKQRVRVELGPGMEERSGHDLGDASRRSGGVHSKPVRHCSAPRAGGVRDLGVEHPPHRRVVPFDCLVFGRAAYLSHSRDCARRAQCR